MVTFNKFACFSFFAFVISLFYIGLGIAEAVIVWEYRDLDEVCDGFMAWIIACCMIDFFTGIAAHCDIIFIVDEKMSRTMLIAHWPQVAMAIWAFIVEYQNDCNDIFRLAPEVRTIVLIHFVIGWILFGLVACALFVGFLYLMGFYCEIMIGSICPSIFDVAFGCSFCCDGDGSGSGNRDGDENGNSDVVMSNV